MDFNYFFLALILRLISLSEPEKLSHHVIPQYPQHVLCEHSSVPRDKPGDRAARVKVCVHVLLFLATLSRPH